MPRKEEIILNDIIKVKKEIKREVIKTYKGFNVWDDVADTPLLAELYLNSDALETEHKEVRDLWKRDAIQKAKVGNRKLYSTQVHFLIKEGLIVENTSYYIGDDKDSTPVTPWDFV